MRFMRTAGVAAIVAATLGGSQKKGATANKSMKESGGDIEAVRQSYAANPDARVGTVVAASPESKPVGVGQVPVTDLRPGDTLTFVNAGSQQIATGQVVKIGKFLIVRYDASGRRAPIKG